MKRLVNNLWFPLFFFLALGVCGCATTQQQSDSMITQDPSVALDKMEKATDAALRVVEQYDKLHGKLDPAVSTPKPTETPTTVDNGDVEKIAKLQKVISSSPRIGGLKIPAGMKPTIKITGWTKGGHITFSSAKFGSGKINDGHEYLGIMVAKDGKVDNWASSHGDRDGRAWEKVGEEIGFMIVLVRNERRELVEISDYIEIKQ